MPWVFDASIAMAWCFADEKTPETDRLGDRLLVDPAIVPALWHLEVANVLTQSMRKRKPRLTLAQRTEFLAFLGNSAITVDPLTHTQAWSATLALADQYLLTTYDAAYLELAIRTGAELATLDRDLRAAAKKPASPSSPKFFAS